MKPFPIIQSFPAVLMDVPNQAAKDAAQAYAQTRARSGKTPTIVYLGRDVDISREKEAFVLDAPEGHRRYAWKLIYENHEMPDFSIEKSFAKMKARFEDRDTKVVMAFSGGGLKVFAHASTVKFLNALGIYPHLDEIWGTSGGAIAAIWYACNLSPEKVQDYGFALYNKLFSLALSPSKLDVVKNLFVNYCLPEKFRPSGFRGIINRTQSLTDFIDNMRKGAPLQKPFYCIAFNIQDLKTEVLTSEPVNAYVHDGKIHQVDPVEATVASCSVPVLFTPKIIRRDGVDTQYIDGGLQENIPMRSIYEKWQADKKAGIEKRKKLLVISSGVQNEDRMDLVGSRILGDRDMPWISLTLLFEAIESSHRALLLQDPNVTLWDFQIPLSNYSVFDVKSIPHFFKAGYQEVAAKAPQIEDLLANRLRQAA